MRANPFVGPRPLTENDPIFGREQELRELLYLLVAERVVLLHSPSGAGKSSLIFAQGGLREKLAQYLDVWEPTRVNLAPPALVNNRFVWSSLVGLHQGQPAADLTQLTFADYVRARRPQRHVCLIIDQFEEIIRTEPATLEERQEFFVQIGDLLRQDTTIWVLFVLREDYLATLDPFCRLVPTHLQNRYRIDRLDRASAAKAIAGTARSGGRQFIGLAAERLAEALSGLGGTVEPLQLQVVCHELWKKLVADDINPVEPHHVTQLANIEASLGGYYESIVVDIAGEDDVASQRDIRLWIGEELITGEVRGMVLRGPATSGMLNTVLADRLVDTHLVRREPRGVSVWFELAHDLLIKPVKESNRTWFETKLHWVQKLALQWAEQGDALLLTDAAKLAEAKAWSQFQSRLTFDESAFLRKSEHAIRVAARERSRNRAMAALAVGAVIAAGLAWALFIRADEAKKEAEKWWKQSTDSEAALYQANEVSGQERKKADLLREEAQTRAELAIAGHAVLKAAQVAAQHFDRALLLALAAYRIAGRHAAPVLSDEVKVDLKSALAPLLFEHRAPGFHVWGHNNAVTSIVFAPSGARAASADTDGKVLIWDAATGRVLRSLTYRGAVMQLAWSSDSRTIEAIGVGAKPRGWNAETGEPVQTALLPTGQCDFGAPDGVYSRVVSTTTSKDCQYRAWVRQDGNFTEKTYRPATMVVQRRYSAAEWSPKPEFTVTLDPYFRGSIQPVLSTNGHFVAWIDGRGPVVQEVYLDQRQYRLTGYTGAVSGASLALSDDGQRLAAGGGDGGIAVWNLQRPYGAGYRLDSERAFVALNGLEVLHPNGKNLFAPNGQSIATWDLDSLPLRRRSLDCNRPLNRLDSVSLEPGTLRLVAGFFQQGDFYFDGGCTTPALPKPPGLISPGKRWLLDWGPLEPMTIANLGAGPRAARVRLGEPWLGAGPELAFSLDERLLAMISNDWDAMQIWSLPGLRSHRISLIAVSGSPLKRRVLAVDDEWVVTSAPSATDTNVYIQNLADGKLIGGPIRNADPDVRVFLPARTGTFLIANQDGVSVRDRATRREIVRIPADDEFLQLSADGRKLVANYIAKEPSKGMEGRKERTAAIWDLDPTHWEKRACEIAGRNLSRAEWAAEFPGLPFETLCPGKFQPGQPAAPKRAR